MHSPFLKSFHYAAKGIATTFRLGFNFKVMLVIAFIAIVLGFVFALSPFEWLIICVCIGLVLGGECLNTAIENTVDLVSPDYNRLAEIAKDCAAAGVLLFSIASFCVGLIIFVPKIFGLIF